MERSGIFGLQFPEGMIHYELFGFHSLWGTSRVLLSPFHFSRGMQRGAFNGRHSP